MRINPLTLIDYYKVDHRRQYPVGTTLVFSNFTPRKSRIEGVNYTVFFGLQYFIKEYLINIWEENFFNIPLDIVIRNWKRRINTSLGPDSTDVMGVEHIVNLHKLGYLPIKILALPEGVKVPIRVPPLVMYNTHDDFSWLVNYLETIMSCSLWQACTSATLAKVYRGIFDDFCKLTGGDPNFIDFQGHDFSFRGMSSLESAVLSGAAHLLSFRGTDSVPAIDFLEEYYNANCETELIGASVPATEHSVMCMGGQESEIDTFRRLFKLYPSGILSVVSDTWDYWHVLTEILPQLKDEIMARDGKLVIRPDSSPKTPYEIICGDLESEELCEHLGSVHTLWEIFGGKVNEAGFRELDPHIGLIYGDSITPDLAMKINARLANKHFASTNWVAGIGSYTYQHNTRDTQGWAMKATYGEILEQIPENLNLYPHSYTRKSEPREIFKCPKTDDGTKKSAKGLIAVYEDNLSYHLKDQCSWYDVHNCAFKTVFENSQLLVDHKLSDIRARLKNS